MKTRWFLIFTAITLGILLAAGCGLAPQMTYQGRLTDNNGNPLNGNYNFTFYLYTDDTDGTLVYSETKTVPVDQGLFDTTLGPSSIVNAGGLTPEDLSKPLWVETVVGNGVITETLSPRQRLLGSPYAFTLMPGAVISGNLNATLEPVGFNAVVVITNTNEDTNALPALSLYGIPALEVDGPSSTGQISSDPSIPGSALRITSNSHAYLYLDNDLSSNAATFSVRRGRQGEFLELCRITYDTANDEGDLVCSGTKSSTVSVDGEERLMFAIESPDVLFEDFATAALQDGTAIVTIDSQFAQAVNLGTDYQIFLTPLGDCKGLYVTDKTATSFTVHELGGGISNIGFDYQIVAKRTGYETVRMPLLNNSAQREEGQP